MLILNIEANGDKQNHYCLLESVRILPGFFIIRCHNARLVALTQTPSPMNFITKVLGRQEKKRPFILITLGFPAENAQIPSLKRKDSSEVIELCE